MNGYQHQRAPRPLATDELRHIMAALGDAMQIAYQQGNYKLLQQNRRLAERVKQLLAYELLKDKKN